MAIGVEARLALLCESQNADGGWGYFAGRESRVEATAYALRALGDRNSHWNKGIEFLTGRRQGDGGLSPCADVPDSTWVTSLAYPLLKRAKVSKLEATAAWILNTEGAEGGLTQRVLHAMGKSVVDQDPALKGWPWRPGNNSWVEPTAHALLAMQWMSGEVPEAGLRYRREMGIRMLLDRRCASMGWNYGNKRVLGEVLPAYPETTGLALMGFAKSGADVSPSLALARTFLNASQSAYTRAILTIALRLNGQTAEYPPPAQLHPSGNLMIAALEALALRETPEAFLP